MSIARFASETAQQHMQRLEVMAQTAAAIAANKGDSRWHDAAIQLRIAIHLYRELVQ